MTLHSCGLSTEDIRLDGKLYVGDEDEDVLTDNENNENKIYDWEWHQQQESDETRLSFTTACFLCLDLINLLIFLLQIL